jgi:subtilisin family serine protease
LAPPLSRRRNQALAVLGSAGLIAGLGTLGPAAAEPAPATGTTATYLVQLADAPAASYTGGVPGYTRTKPVRGKLDAAAPAVSRYRGYLRQRQDGVLKQAPSARRLSAYSVTFNGFAARMTAADAAKLARTAGVRAVVKDERRKPDTTRTPEFLGLTKPIVGLWAQNGGPRRAGEGVVVGSLDTGLWPESPSVAPLASPRPVPQFTGTCQTGEQWDASDCTTKVVGARYYTAGVTAGVGDIKAAFPYEYLSARDADGHGTHTATTAAGNHGVPVVVEGTDFGRASGMAPRARIATYKVCWGRDEEEAGCYNTDTVQAIEDATTDGVDVINYSIGGSLTSSVDPVQLAFFGAAEAGVFVATSAGNSGPGASTVAHNSPWVTTTAAGTLDRTGTKSVTLGNGTTYQGVGLGPAVPSSPLILSTAAGRAGADPTQVRLCFLGTLDPAKVTGKIVVCDRGVNPRTDKSLEVRNAGGVGMVLANTAPSSLNADIHFVPTVHVDETAGAAIKAYAATAGATASLSVGTLQFGVKAPQVATFSSRGPALSGAGDLLKPDIMAPGVDILAGVSPAGHHGRLYDFVSGTSMASPHIAGLAALVIQRHPDWSPMAVKSALMTTASQRDNQNAPITTDTGGTAGPFDYGSGHVTPNAASNPGLVYDSTSVDWVRYLCGAGQLSATGSTCSTYGRIDPSDLNQPNIAIGALAGRQTVTRTVTNVSRLPGIYVPQVQAPAGVSVTVSPKVLLVAAGGTASYRVTFTRTTAAFGQSAFGSLTWTNGLFKVRSQLVVRPVAAAAPAQVTGSGTTGSTAIQVTPGFTGTLTAAVAAGLVPADRLASTLSPTGPGFDPTAPAASARTAKYSVTIPAGTTLTRVSTFDRDFAAGTDVDIYLYRGGTTARVGQSAGATAEEQIQLANPTAGTYDLYVVLFGAAPGQSSVETPAFVWNLGSTPAGNLTVTPASQATQAGVPVTVTAAWSGLTAGQRYLGRVAFGDGTAVAGSTLVRVDA